MEQEVHRGEDVYTRHPNWANAGDGLWSVMYAA